MDSVCWQRRTAGSEKKQRDILIFKLLHHVFHVPPSPPDKRQICFIQYVLINLQFLTFDRGYQNRNPLRRSPTTVETGQSHRDREQGSGVFQRWSFVFSPRDADRQSFVLISNMFLFKNEWMNEWKLILCFEWKMKTSEAARRSNSFMNIKILIRIEETDMYNV